MASDWWKTTLAEVSSDIAYGYTESATKEAVGPKFLRITDIQGGVVDWRSVPHCPISPGDRGKYKLEPGDLVVARTGNSTGENFLYRGGADAVFASYLVRFRLDRARVDDRFVWYNLRARSWWDFISSSKTGSAQAGANAKVLGSFPLNLPPLREQHAIASILGSLDDKIELNGRRSQTLEATARAIFQSWFVDFDPVRAKADGRQPPGIAAPLAALFPDRFEESSSGPVPAGWAYRPLGEIVELQRGRTYKSGLIDLPGPALLGLGSIQRNGGFRDDNLSTYGGECPENLILRPGDIFVSLKDVTQSADLLGAVARVPPHVHCGRLTQDTVALRFADSTASRGIVYRTLLTAEYRGYCKGHATGTTNLGLSRSDFLSYPIIQPCSHIQGLFERHLSAIEARINSSTAEAIVVTALRDALLPKLVSGELRVRDAERIAGRCL